MTKRVENFDTLIKKALKEWPDHITFGSLDIDSHPNYPRDSFGVEGLYELYDEICDKYTEPEHNILWLKLHHAIYIVVHGAAKYVSCLDISNLRQLEIKYHFENMVKSSIDNKYGASREEDIQLAHDYFAAQGRPLKKSILADDANNLNEK